MSQPPYPQSTTSYSYGSYPTTPAGSYPPGTYASAAYSTPGAYTSTNAAGSYGGTPGWPYPYGYFPAQPGTSTPAAARPATAYTAASTSQRPSTPAATGAPTAKAASFQQYNPSSTSASSYTKDTAAGPGPAAGGGRGKNKANFKGLFVKELRNLMYGFGDDRNPASDSVNVMEEILIEYIVDVCQTAAGGKKSRLSIEDLRKVLARPADAKKLARMEELLFMQEDIKRARAQIDEPEMEARNFA